MKHAKFPWWEYIDAMAESASFGTRTKERKGGSPPSRRGKRRKHDIPEPKVTLQTHFDKEKQAQKVFLAYPVNNHRGNRR